MRLLLFDIDGTLVISSSAGRESMRVALERTFDTAGPIDSLSFAGMTDSQIIRTLMTAAGFEMAQIEPRLNDVYQRMREDALHRFFRNGLAPCPGVKKLLAQLSSTKRVVLGLLTGNNRLTAPLKLEAAGIDPGIFRIGAFGSDAADRTALIHVAWRKAQQEFSVQFTRSTTTIIGDTPADIECARACGVRVLAVSTGLVSMETLHRSNPDYLVSDLTNTNSVLEMIL